MVLYRGGTNYSLNFLSVEWSNCAVILKRIQWLNTNLFIKSPIKKPTAKSH